MLENDKHFKQKIKKIMKHFSTDSEYYKKFLLMNKVKDNISI